MSRTSAWFLLTAGWLLVAAAFVSAVQQRVSWTLIGVAGIAVILAGATRLGERS